MTDALISSVLVLTAPPERLGGQRPLATTAETYHIHVA
jgi:hypothetical protein